MPNVNVYLPAHLNNRRSELDPEETLSGMLVEKLEERLGIRTTVCHCDHNSPKEPAA